jgi:hypothetical protein
MYKNKIKKSLNQIQGKIIYFIIVKKTFIFFEFFF